MRKCADASLAPEKTYEVRIADSAVEHMRKQVHNDALGWDDPLYDEAEGRLSDLEDDDVYGVDGLIVPASPEADRAERLGIAAASLALHDLLEENPRLVSDAPQFQRDLFAVVSLTHLLLLQEQDGAKIPHPVLLPPAAHPAERLELYLASLQAAGTGLGPPPVDREDIARAQAELERPREPTSPPQRLSPPPAEGWLSGPARRALQVAVAGSLSIVAGMALSPERWYWAALTVFFVFANANSRGATLRKAVERTLGTVGGIAAGLLRPAAGTVSREDAALADEHLALDERQTLGAALAFWARLDGVSAVPGMEAMGIGHLADVPVRMLSTGQRKRATLARVLACNAPLWLLDEPANGLDADGQERLEKGMAAHRIKGGSILAASHQPLALPDAATLVMA